MLLRLAAPLPPPDHLMPWLHQRLPLFQYRVVGDNLLIVAGEFTGLLVKRAPAGAELVGAGPPGMFPRILIGLGFAAGVLPGVFLYLIMLLLVRGRWGRMQTQVTAALEGRPIPLGPGIPQDSPFAAQGADAIIAAGGPSSDIGRLEPRWLLAIATLFFVGTALAGAWTVNLLQARGRGEESDERDRAELALAADNLAWREKSGKPPKRGCPEKDLPPLSYAGSLHDSDCHGCGSHTKKPSPIENSDWKIHKRKKDWLVCGPVDDFKGDYRDAKSRVSSNKGYQQEGTELLRNVFAVFAVLLLLSSTLGWVWWSKNRIARKKREEEITQQRQVLEAARA